jgi:hypothetical protein
VAITAHGRWKFYRARLEAYEVNGSYEFTSGDFKGGIATPSIDRLSAEPGPGWERLERPPSEHGALLVFILYCGDAKEALLAACAEPVVPTADNRLKQTVG